MWSEPGLEALLEEILVDAEWEGQSFSGLEAQGQLAADLEEIDLLPWLRGPAGAVALKEKRKRRSAERRARREGRRR